VSSIAAACTILAVLTVTLPALYWQLRRAAAESTRDRLVCEARDRASLPPAAPDNEAGVNGADLDECELIWATPLHDPTGFDRLRNALREHREEDN
jgi:hypothetical protein